MAALEFAMIAAVFMLLLFGTMDLARFFATQHGVRIVAADAARAALVNPGWTFSCAAPTSGTASLVAAAAPILAPASLTLCVTHTVNGSKTTITATASYPFAFVIPILAGANQTLSDTVTMSY